MGGNPANYVDPEGKIIANVVGGVLGGVVAYVCATSSIVTGDDLVKQTAIGVLAVAASCAILNPAIGTILTGGIIGGLGNIISQKINKPQCPVDKGKVIISTGAGLFGGAMAAAMGPVVGADVVGAAVSSIFGSTGGVIDLYGQGIYGFRQRMNIVGIR